MNCPRCHGLLEKPAYCSDCGWTRPAKAETPAPSGPDYARIAADRERSIASALEPVAKKLACQSIVCPPTTRALPDRDLCQACADLEDSGREVRRIRRPTWARSAGELVAA